MRLSLEFYELLRNAINLSEVVRQKVALVKKSSNYLGLCPFHNEKTPSFTVNELKKFYYCFGCGAHGDVIKFSANILGLSYSEAAIKLAQDYHIEIPKLTKEQEKKYEESEQVIEILTIAAEFFKSQLTPQALNYLMKRGINKQTIEHFSIGFAPPGDKLKKFFEARSVPLILLSKAGLVAKTQEERMYEVFRERIMFPIHNVYGKVIGFGGRVLDDKLPKYLNSPETMVFKKNQTLYAADKAINAAYKNNWMILVEGYLDVISLHQAGFTGAIASLGTAITPEHLHKTWKMADEIIICLDGDEAGVKASSRVISLALSLVTRTKKIAFVLLPTRLDPEEVINQMGKEFFQQLVDQRISLSQMIWHLEYSGKFFKTAEACAELESRLENYSSQIKDRTLSLNYRRFFKEQIWINLSKYNAKKLKVITTPGLSNNYSELELLERRICTILIKFPEILRHEEIKNLIAKITLNNPQLSDLLSWLVFTIESQEDCNAENLKEAIKITRFYNLFLLLLKMDSLFLNSLCSKKDLKPALFGEWLYKNYYLIAIKQEYNSIEGEIERLEKLNLYSTEITKTLKDLQELNELFIH